MNVRNMLEDKMKTWFDLNNAPPRHMVYKQKVYVVEAYCEWKQGDVRGVTIKGTNFYSLDKIHLSLGVEEFNREVELQ